MEALALTFVWAFVTLAFLAMCCPDRNPSSPFSVNWRMEMHEMCMYVMLVMPCLHCGCIRGDRDTKWFRAKLQCRPVEFVSVQLLQRSQHLGFLCTVTKAISWISQGGKWWANGCRTWQCPSHQSLLGELQSFADGSVSSMRLFHVVSTVHQTWHLESQASDHVFE